MIKMLVSSWASSLLLWILRKFPAGLLFIFHSAYNMLQPTGVNSRMSNLYICFCMVLTLSGGLCLAANIITKVITAPTWHLPLAGIQVFIDLFFCWPTCFQMGEPRQRRCKSPANERLLESVFKPRQIGTAWLIVSLVLSPTFKTFLWEVHMVYWRPLYGVV